MSSCCQPSPLDATTGSAAADFSEEGLRWFYFGLAVTVAGLSMVLGIAVNLDPPTGITRMILHGLLGFFALFLFALLGRATTRRAWAGLRRGQITVDLMFLAGMGGAFAASAYSSLTGTGEVYYEVVTILLAIRWYGDLLVERARSHAKDALGEMAESVNRCRRVLCCGGEEVVSASAIRTGDHIRVNPGESIPIDGTVLEGSGFVEETIHTGEPFPVVRQPGDPIRAGSLNVDGRLTLEAAAHGGNREIDRLLHAFAVEDAAPSKYEETANRIIAVFLPAVVGISTLTFLFWFFQGQLQDAIFRALAVLLVACPCALGLAMPITIWRARQALARMGIVVRDSGFLEGAAGADTVLFDKTGTLCSPQLTVREFRQHVANPLLETWIGTIQQQCAHPVARPFFGWGDPENPLQDLRIFPLPGIGIRAIFKAGEGGEQVVEIGNHRLLKRPDPRTEKRVLFVQWNGKLAATALLEENVFAGAARCLSDCSRIGLRPVILTGDTAVPAVLSEAAEGVATGLSSREKSQRAGEYANALFVGDGLNDVEAMHASRTSLAVGGSHPVSRDQADAELVGQRLELLPDAILVARRVRRLLRVNLGIALTYNLVGISAAATGFLHPILAAVLMFAASLTVVSRALRHPLFNPRTEGKGGSTRERVRMFANPEAGVHTE